MLRAHGKEQLFELGSFTNLEDLRSQLATRLAMLLIGTSSLAIWLSLPQNPFSIKAFSLFFALLGLGLTGQALVNNHPTLARHLLGWGLVLGLLAAMALFPGPSIPFLGVLLIFLNGMLIARSELATAGLIAAVAAWLNWEGGRSYPLPDLFAALALGVVVAWLVVNTLYTALEWTRNMQHRADRLLDEVRNHRAELSRTLKSSTIANSLLRRTQDELVAARKQADQARRMKEQFAANVSHELRTPLNLVLGFSEIMYRSPELYGDMVWPPNLRQDVYQIYRSSRHLVDMIDDILDLSRFEMTGFSLNKEPTPLTPLLEETALIATDLFRARAIELVVEIPPALPTLALDRTRIRQVLLNLLNNARRFTEAGTVRLAAERSKREVIIQVSDTGSGIPEDKLPHIFDEFFQVDLSLRRRHQGAGLGLAISKRFVQMHGGSIWAESQEGAGSTFFFSLPLTDTAHPASSLTTPDQAGALWSERTAASILVVDSDPAVAALVGRFLEKERYEIVPVTDTGKLASEIKLYHPRAVILNVAPGGNGSSLKEVAGLGVPMIECSLPGRTVPVEDLTVLTSLTKPVMAEQLLSQIARLSGVNDVLVIDDDRGFVQLVQRILESAGHNFRIQRAYDGAEGLLAMQSQPPDLLLLDLIMPGMDGFQVLEQMRQHPALTEIPVLLLTATNLAKDEPGYGSGQVVIRRSGGLRPDEVLSCLRAAVEILEPRYDEIWLPEEEPLPA